MKKFVKFEFSMIHRLLAWNDGFSTVSLSCSSLDLNQKNVLVSYLSSS